MMRLLPLFAPGTVLVLFLVQAQAALAQDSIDAAPALAAPPEEDEVARRSDRLAAGLRCPVCQGLSAADSQAESAVAMRVRTEDLVRAGYSDTQIQAYFVERYGEWVLLEPPRRGLHWLIWLGPLVVLGGGALTLAWRLTATTPAQGALIVEGERGPRDRYEQAILDELEG